MTFIKGTITFADRAVTSVGRAEMFVSGAVTFISGAVTFIGGAATFIGKAVTFVGGAVTFIGKGSSAIRRPFKTAKARIAGNIKINGHNLRQRLIIYKLKGPSLLIYSLISTSNHSVRSSS